MAKTMFMGLPKAWPQTIWGRMMLKVQPAPALASRTRSSWLQ